MERPSICLICLIGLPASGKSTLARNIEERFKLKYDVDIVSFDKEITWDKDIIWKNKRRIVFDLVVNQIENYLRSNKKDILLILDDNMFYRSMRYEYYQQARKYEIGFCEIYLSTPLNVCLKLNSKRANPVYVSTILNMNEKLEPPDSNNKWETNSLITNNVFDLNDWMKIEKLILYSLQTPEKHRKKYSKINYTHNAIHFADLALRKVIGDLMKERKETHGNFGQFGLKLTKNRQQILENIRNGDLILPEVNNENCVMHFSKFLRPYLLNFH